MKISNLPAWHAFVYTQLYPAVLGSMLYDLLHLSANWNIAGFVKLSLTVFFVIDYFNIHADLKSDDIELRNGFDVFIDGIVAILLGLSYWFMVDTRLFDAYLLVAVVTTFFLLYYLRGPRRKFRNTASMIVLLCLAIAAAYFHYYVVNSEYLIVLLAALPPIAYAGYVFFISNRQAGVAHGG